jgi:hypothetical protein
MMGWNTKSAAQKAELEGSPTEFIETGPGIFPAFSFYTSVAGTIAHRYCVDIIIKGK